jgi:hypothetical protein
MQQWPVCSEHLHMIIRDQYQCKYYSGDQPKEDEMGGACCICGGEEKCIQGLVGGET